MKLKITLAIASAAFSVAGQGAFQNLDFESANLSPVAPSPPPTFVSITSALPGWTGYLGNVQQTQVLQNGQSFGGPSIDIFGPNWTYVDPGLIDGSFTVMLQAGPGENASIAQDGTIPASDVSIEFKAWNYMPSTGILTVSFAGNSLSPIVIGSGPNYTLYGTDVSAFAGQSGNLDFTSVFNSAGPSWIELDDIAFSTQAVPEPSPLVLTGMGGLVLALYRRRACRQR